MGIYASRKRGRQGYRQEEAAVHFTRIAPRTTVLARPGR